MAESTIKKCTSTVGYAIAPMSANSDHVAISAPKIRGYTFWYWINVHTSGWVEGLYIEDPLSANTSVWRNNGILSPSIDSGGDVYALAAYKRS